MKFYIALGGLACRALRERAATINDGENYYIDTDVSVRSYLDFSDNVYFVPNLSSGTATLRQIGRNAIKYELFSGKMTEFFSKIKDCDYAEITLFTSSFGGFGSSAAIEILDYLECMLYEKPNHNNDTHCKVIAFNEAYFDSSIGVIASVQERFKYNTIEMVNEFLMKRTPIPYAFLKNSFSAIFDPKCDFFLIDTSRFKDGACISKELHTILDKSNAELSQMDVQKQYYLKSQKDSPAVFISYSFLDQTIADLLVDSLEQNGMNCWIASRNIHQGSYAKQIIQGIREAKIFVVLLSKNSIASEQVKNEIDRAFSRIKDGLKIIPFIIDDSELDDECSYYLCRQEFYFGQNPPIKERINELVAKISDMME